MNYRESFRKSILITVILLAVIFILTLTSCNNDSYVDNASSIVDNINSTIDNASIALENNSPVVDNTSPVSAIQPGSFAKLPEEDAARKLLAGMSIDEKIGQLIIGGYDNIAEILPVISENKLGGVILYKKNIRSVSQTIRDINILKESNQLNKIPIFISIDQEGGKVSRLPEEMGIFESALSVGNRNDPAYAFNFGSKTAKTLKQLGFNLNFAPIMDIYSNPRNTIIADRSFGITPERVSRIGLQVMKGLGSENIISTVKHFPGHGDTETDSHLVLPVVNKSLAELNNFEFKPFVEAIQNDVDMIMIAHIVLSKVDLLPSSLSSEVVTTILRKQLSYKGVIITDDITMGAITENYTISEAAVKAVNAGCDIVFVAQGTRNSVLVLNSLKSALQNGQLTEQRLDESVYRILSLKLKHGLKNQG
jgi:beta-N-acetylhexosaminidase